MTGYDVTLERADGPDRTIAVEEGETVLEAAQRVGVRLPYDCRKGTCTACVGRVVAVGGDEEPGEGDDGSDGGEPDRRLDATTAVEYRRPPQALDGSERADGYALLCIALPRTDCRIEVGPRIRAEVGDSPWK